MLALKNPTDGALLIKYETSPLESGLTPSQRTNGASKDGRTQRCFLMFSVNILNLNEKRRYD